MAIEGVSSIQMAGYQVNQPVQKQVETVSIDPANTAVSADMAAKVQTVKSSDNAESGLGYENQKRGEATNEQIKKAVEQMNKSMFNSEAVFGIHEGTNRVTIKIVDKDTKEVIKELPPEKTLDMIAKVWEMAGILLDERR